MAEVFISYERKSSAPLANLVYKGLKDKGIETFLDTQDMTGVGLFPQLLRLEIERANIFSCLIGKTTLNSKWVKKEIRHAHKLNKILIPIFQESFRKSQHDQPEYISALLKSNGIKIFERQGIFFEAAISELFALIKHSSEIRTFALTSGIKNTSLKQTLNPKDKRKKKSKELDVKSRQRVTLTLDMQRSAVDIQKLIELIAALVNVGIEDITLTNIALGSVKITLEMPGSALEQLLDIILKEPETLAQYNLKSIEKTRNRQIHIITSFKGFVGKTLITLAALLHSAVISKKVLGLDYDPMHPDLFNTMKKLSNRNTQSYDEFTLLQLTTDTEVLRFNNMLPYLTSGDFWHQILKVTEIDDPHSDDIFIDAGNLTNIFKSEGPSSDININLRQILEGPNDLNFWILWTNASTNDPGWLISEMTQLEEVFSGRVRCIHVLNPSAISTPNIDMSSVMSIVSDTKKLSEHINQYLERYQDIVNNRAAQNLIENMRVVQADMIERITNPEVPIASTFPNLKLLANRPITHSVSVQEFADIINKLKDSTLDPEELLHLWGGSKPWNILPITLYNHGLTEYTNKNTDPIQYIDISGIILDISTFLSGFEDFIRDNG